MKMQTKWRWQCVALLAILLVAGCGQNREAQLVGKWKADASSMNLPSTKPGDVQAKAMAEMMKDMMSNMSIDLKADKSFDMNMFMKMSGTWAVDEAAKTLVLTPTKIADVDVTKTPGAGNKPITFQIAPDNSRLSIQDPSGKNVSKGAMTFVRE